MDYTGINLNFVTCCCTLQHLPSSNRILLDVVNILGICHVLDNKAYEDVPNDLHPDSVLADYISVCEMTGVTVHQVSWALQQMNAKYRQLIHDVCHEIKIPAFSNPWELESCIRNKPPKAVWPPLLMDKLQQCLTIVDAHLATVCTAAATGQSAAVRSTLLFILMQPHDLAISQIQLKVKRLKMTKPTAQQPVLCIPPPTWMLTAPEPQHAMPRPNTQGPAPDALMHDRNDAIDPNLVLLPPDAMPVPSFRQFSIEEAQNEYEEVLQDGIKHNCSCCLECRASRQLKAMSLKKFARLPINWVNRMIPSTATIGENELHASIDRPFIQHLCQQAGHHAEMVPQEPAQSVPMYTRKLVGPDFGCQYTLQQLHTSVRLCSTCHRYLNKPQFSMPPRSVMNGSCLPALPEQIAAMTEINERLLSIHQAFAEIRHLPRGGQHQVKGSVIHVASDLHTLHHKNLPRTPDVLLVRVKRNLQYAGHTLARYSDLQTVRRQMRYLKNTPLYQEALLQGVDDALKDLIQEAGGVDMNDASLDAHERHMDDTMSGEHMPVQSPHAEPDMQHENSTCAKDHGHDDDSCSSHSGCSSDEEDNIRKDPKYGEKYPSEVLIDAEIPPHVLPAMVRKGYNELSVAPCSHNHPMSVLSDAHGAEKCFVHAFCGQRMTLNNERPVKLTYQELNKHLLSLIDKRVAQRTAHIFFILRRLQLLKVINETRIRLRQCSNSAYTAAQVKSDEGQQKLERDGTAQKILSSVRTTPAYMQDARNKAHAMLRQLGTPTWFYTLTCRGHRQKELVKTLYELHYNKSLSDEQYETLTFQDITHLMQKDATTCARTFNEQLNAYIKYVLVGCKDAFGGVCDYFIMTEYQQRGDAHVHGVAWVPNAPKYGINTNDEVVAFIDRYVSCDVHGAPPNIISAQIHKHTDTCRKNKKRACRFFFPKFPMRATCILEPFKDGELTCAEAETCLKRYNSICKHLKDLYDAESSQGYRNTEDKRTFDEFLTYLGLDEDQYMQSVRSSLTAPAVFLKRNVCDIYVNQYSRHGLSILGSNMDIQFILDPYAAVKYITSYMCKSQRGVSELLDRICKQNDDTLNEKIRALGREFIKGTSVCAQEAVNLIMGNAIMRSTRQTIFIPTGLPDQRTRILKSRSKLESLDDDDTDIYQKGLLERYMSRPASMHDMCLAEFAAMWEPVYGKQQQQQETQGDDMDGYHGLQRDDADIDTHTLMETEQEQDHMTVQDFNTGMTYRQRHFPKIIRYVNHPLRVNAELHYREQCMLYVPWRYEHAMKPDSEETWEAWYRSNENLINLRHAQYESMKLDNIEAAARQADMEQQIYGEALPVPNRKSEFLTEAHILDALGVAEAQMDPVSGVRKQTPVLGKLSKSPGRVDDHAYAEQVARLNYEQRAYLNHILHHCKCTDPVQVIEFLSGGAGVGKSVLIHALVQTIIRTAKIHDPNSDHEPDRPVVLTAAPTGTAAFGVKGQTLHSMFHIRPNSNMMEDLPQSSWQQLHHHFSKLKWLIIDEISLVQRGMLEAIENRLRQIMASCLPFGGVNVLFVGDLYQLRPAGGAWVFADKNSNDSRKFAGNLWKEHVTMFELHTIMRQRESAEFAETLNRIRVGSHTQQDLDRLSALAVAQPNPTTLQLCSTHALCDAANQHAYERAKAMNPTITEALILAENTASTGMTYANRVMAEKEAAQREDLGKLRQRLRLYEGQTVELTTNIDNEDGLTNGASGTVDLISWLPGSSRDSRPHIIWISFHEPERGMKQREKFAVLKSKLDASIPDSSVPIFVVSKQDTQACIGVSRTQFPLSPAHARTIHHVQGVTIHALGHIDWGSWNPGGLLYVALSRFTEMNNITLGRVLTHKDVTVDKQAHAEVQRLRQADNEVQLSVTPIREVRIKHLSETSKHLFVMQTHNVRSLKKHWRFISTDYDLPMCDVLSLQETKMNASVQISDYNLPNCTLHHDNSMHEMRNHHGVCTYVQEHLPCVLLDVQCEIPTGMNIQVMRLGPETCGLLYVNMYRSPNMCSPHDCISCLSDIFAQHMSSCKYTVCCGDFNLDVEAPAYTHLLNMMTSLGMLNIVPYSTHDEGGVLDHIWTTIPVADCRCYMGASPFSDHRPVWLAWEACPWAHTWKLPPSLHQQTFLTESAVQPASIENAPQTAANDSIVIRAPVITLKRSMKHVALTSRKLAKASSSTSPGTRLLIKRQFTTEHLANIRTAYVPPFMPIQGVHKTSFQEVSKLTDNAIDWAQTGFFAGNTWYELGGVANNEFVDMQMLHSLTNRNLLCGSILSFCLLDIAERSTNSGAITWAMPTTWSAHLLGNNLNQNNLTECLQGLVRNRHLDQTKTPVHVLVPICRNNMHYFLVYMNVLTRNIWVLDSCTPNTAEINQVFETLQSFVISAWPACGTTTAWKRSIARCTLQSNGTECGIHCIANAACIIAGEPLDYPETYLQFARQAIYSTIQSMLQTNDNRT